MLQRVASAALHGDRPHVSNPISGEVGAAAYAVMKITNRKSSAFQTPSAGRWVLQLQRINKGGGYPICFKPHQRGGGCCSECSCHGGQGQRGEVSNPISGEVGAAALQAIGVDMYRLRCCFKPHQRGGGCCSFPPLPTFGETHEHVSNPISGEVGAAACQADCCLWDYEALFQTPSAGRWVLQPLFQIELIVLLTEFQTPSAGRWVLQRTPQHLQGWRSRFKPHQRGGGCCSCHPYLSCG